VAAGWTGCGGGLVRRFTQDLMGWQPTQPGLIEDIEEGHYFS
jgi:hypothetical protein